MGNDGFINERVRKFLDEADVYIREKKRVIESSSPSSMMTLKSVIVDPLTGVTTTNVITRWTA